MFDISDSAHPREVAYFHKPAPDTLPLKSGVYPLSAPAFAWPTTRSFADGDSGCYAVKLTNDVWPRGLTAS